MITRPRDIPRTQNIIHKTYNKKKTESLASNYVLTGVSSVTPFLVIWDCYSVSPSYNTILIQR